MSDNKFEFDQSQFIDELNRVVIDTTEQTARAVFEGVVRNSPVDSGSYRASWTASVGSPVYEFRKGGSSQAPQPAPTWQGLPIKMGDIVYISNGAPYAGEIENGHSGQAPRGVAALTVASLGL